MIIYGNCRGWDSDEFKSNLQGLFLVNDAIALVNHGLVGNLTPIVLKSYLWVLPVIALGLLAGTRLDHILNPQRFRKLVLISLVVMGVRLILLAF
jgi:hypothetical protein